MAEHKVVIRIRGISDEKCNDLFTLIMHKRIRIVFFEFYVISKRYDVYLVAYKSAVG